MKFFVVAILMILTLCHGLAPAHADVKNKLYSKDRFIDNRDGTITDRSTGLMWLKNGWKLDFFIAIPWFDAIQKLTKFRHGNYDDWRLPSNEEWRSLIDTRNQNPALVEPNPFVNIICHMPYWSRTEYMYGQRQLSDPFSALESYIVLLYYGKFGHQNKLEWALVFPVRSIR